MAIKLLRSRRRASAESAALVRTTRVQGIPPVCRSSRHWLTRLRQKHATTAMLQPDLNDWLRYAVAVLSDWRQSGSRPSVVCKQPLLSSRFRFLSRAVNYPLVKYQPDNLPIGSGSSFSLIRQYFRDDEQITIMEKEAQGCAKSTAKNELQLGAAQFAVTPRNRLWSLRSIHPPCPLFSGWSKGSLRLPRRCSRHLLCPRSDGGPGQYLDGPRAVRTLAEDPPSTEAQQSSYTHIRLRRLCSANLGRIEKSP